MSLAIERDDASMLRVPSSAGFSWRSADAASDWSSSVASETDNDPELRASSGVPGRVGRHDEQSINPDISMLCELCNRYIDLRVLSDHRNFHRALNVLRYKEDVRPESVEKLLLRRRSLIRQLKEETTCEIPLDPCEVQKLNDAYEILKSDLEDTFEAYRQLKHQPNTKVSGISVNCSADCAYAVGICSDGNHRWKSSMEDTRVFQNNFGNDRHKCFLGIYDGYHGPYAAELVSNELHQAVLNNMSKFDPKTKCACVINAAELNEPPAEESCEIHSRVSSKCSERSTMYAESQVMIQKIIAEAEEKLAEYDEKSGISGSKRKKREKSAKERDPFADKMASAFRKAHYYSDVLLSWGKDEQSRVRWSGCSTLCCIVHDKTSTGDSTEEKDSENSNTHIDIDRQKGSRDLVNKEPNIDQEGAENRIVGPPKKLGVIYLSNAGNTHAVLVRGNRAYRLSRDHTPYNAKEKTRILKEGGTVNESEKQLRVNGIIATTRGVGNHGDPALKACVIAEPYTTSVPIDQYAQFLILASNGVWEVFKEQDAASLLTQMLPSNSLSAPSRINSSVYALWDNLSSQPGSTTQDDTSHRDTPTSPLMNTTTEMPPTGSSIPKLRPGTGMSKAPQSSVRFVEDGNHYRHQADTNGQGKNILNGGVSHDNKSVGKCSKFASDHDDLQTEAGSQMGDDDDEMSHSGNGVDVKAYLDDLSLNSDTLTGGANTPSRAEMQRLFARAMAERLVQAALMTGSKDNITVMVVLLPGCGL